YWGDPMNHYFYQNISFTISLFSLCPSVCHSLSSCPSFVLLCNKLMGHWCEMCMWVCVCMWRRELPEKLTCLDVRKKRIPLPLHHHLLLFLLSNPLPLPLLRPLHPHLPLPLPLPLPLHLPLHLHLHLHLLPH